MKKYLYWIPPIIWAILIWRLTTTPQIIVTDNSWLQNILMMGAHFTFFGIQAVLLRFSITNNSSILITSLYGAFIEFRQLSVPGRSADPLDWALDTLGAIFMLWLLTRLSKRFNL